MEENETPDPIYQKGFNEGYIIAKHLPEFNAKPVEGLENSSRGMGFQDGQKQFLFEKNIERLPYLKKDRNTKGKTDLDKTNKDSRD